MHDLGKIFSQFGIFQCSLDMANVKMLLAKAGAESVKLYNHNV